MPPRHPQLQLFYLTGELWKCFGESHYELIPYDFRFNGVTGPQYDMMIISNVIRLLSILIFLINGLFLASTEPIIT